MGDSLLYAALNTSGKIYGINHNKNAVKNLNINEVDRRIKFINCEYSDGKNIKLSEIFEKYCNDADYVYIDAKTCENKFLSEENDSFEKIKRIAVKSYADPEVVKAKLEKYGFTASITKMRIINSPIFTGKIKNYSIIFQPVCRLILDLSVQGQLQLWQ
ncbi:hypothetical protein [Acidiplasma cupricumulans]|uniref:hypothetical protein n=1 Tax=Acidiplasma cupricumulans TaxID=312540 RepID=UPI000A730D68|nr:hypothetical protein [Acidiplasma cupricumulans]